MDLEKWIPDYVLYMAIGTNYVTALVGAYVASTELMLLSIFSIACLGLAVWSRKKQRDDKK
mgnify:CR=1 FL=1